MLPRAEWSIEHAGSHKSAPGMLWCTIIFQKARTAMWATGVPHSRVASSCAALSVTAVWLQLPPAMGLPSEERQLLSAPATTTSPPSSNWLQQQKLPCFFLISEAVTVSFHFCSQPVRPNYPWQALRDTADGWLHKGERSPTHILPGSFQII